MSAQAGAHKGYEPDLDQHISGVMWGYFLGFVIMLVITIGALIMYFRYEAHKEQYVKVGARVSQERVHLRRGEDAFLSGKTGARVISIDKAMKKFVGQQK